MRPGAELLDITRLNPTVADAAGGMISTTTDLNRYLAALLDGRLLPPAQQRDLLDTRPTGRASGSEYGLGLEWTTACGGGIWGHHGDMLGFSVRAGATYRRQAGECHDQPESGWRAGREGALDTVVPTALCGH